jgi:type I restriction enzyme S subunit
MQRIFWLKSGDFITAEQIEPEGQYPVYGGNGLRGFTDRWNTEGPIILIGRQGAHCGNVHIASARCWISEHALRCIPEKSYSIGFVRYALQTLGLNQYSVSAAQPGLSVDNIKPLRIPFPRLDIQKRIAAFLDEKTAQIDALIEKKRALLDRLAEKRQAIITHAVTKGLNPATPMKDSGIDWLGQIPTHWGIIPLKWQCFIASGQVDPAEPPYDGMTLVAPDHIESGSGRLIAKQTSAEQSAISGKYLCHPGDVLYSKIRPALRKVTLTDDVCLCSADMYSINPGVEYERNYLFYFLLTDAFTSYAELASMRVAMPKVNREALGTFPLPKPPSTEQKSIINFLKMRVSAVDLASASVHKSIEQLSEYRSALITAAVTGQLEI